MKKLTLGLLIGALFLTAGLHAQATGPKKKGPVGISGWVIFWDEGNKSVAAFEKHANQIDRAYLELYHLTPDGMPGPVTQATPDLKARVMTAAAKNGVEIWYMIGNYDVAINDHNKEWVEKFLYDSALRAKHIQALIAYAKQDKVAGIQIDYENLLAKDKDAFSQFMAELKAAANANGFKVGIALPAKVDASGTWDDPQSRDYSAIGKSTDEFVPMTYDAHWSTSAPGYVTAPGWSEDCMKYAASVVPLNELEVGYPAYGYDWVGTHGDSITWQQFQDTCAKYKVKPVRDTDFSQELKIDYTDEKGQQHEAWIPDSRCLEAQANIVKRNKLYGLGVWYFGCEDESFWTTMKQINATTQETNLFANETTQEAATSGPLEIKDILTDKVPVDYAYAYPEGGSKVTVVEKQGKRWIDVAMKGDAWSGFGVGTAQKNLVPYLQKGALQFYVRGGKGGETSTVCFIMAKGSAADEKFSLVSEVDLANYTKVTTKWQLVTIPLSDFPVNGYHHDDDTDSKIVGPFKWDRVIEFGGNHTPNADPNCEILFSSVRIVPSYDAKAVDKAKMSALGGD